MAKKLGKTLFGKAKSKKYAKIIKLTDIDAAQKSIDTMEKEFKSAKTRKKKLHIIRAINLASIRASVISKNPRITKPVRDEKKKIAKVFRKSQQGLSRKYKQKKRDG